MRQRKWYTGDTVTMIKVINMWQKSAFGIYVDFQCQLHMTPKGVHPTGNMVKGRIEFVLPKP